MKLIYGSTAIKHWFPNFKHRPNDIDYICDENIRSTREAEYYWTESFEYIKENNIDKEYVDPNLLYTIKLSHLSWDINWDKHMGHLIFLKKNGCKVDEEFYVKLTSDWKALHGTPKGRTMNVKNSEFFTQIIGRRFDHDWLHTQLALNGAPMHERIRKDPISPKCSKDLWNGLSYEEQLDCAIEELYVLVAERHILIDTPLLPIGIAKVEMLKTMITSTTSGWFNMFLKENFRELLDYKPSKILNKIKRLGVIEGNGKVPLEFKLSSD